MKTDLMGVKEYPGKDWHKKTAADESKTVAEPIIRKQYSSTKIQKKYEKQNY